VFHKLLSTDGPGTACLRCGAAFDYEGEDGKESWVPCVGADDGDWPHHWADEGDRGLSCAYCEETVTDETVPAEITLRCVPR
jgi:hypothetical protein